MVLLQELSLLNRSSTPQADELSHSLILASPIGNCASIVWTKRKLRTLFKFLFFLTFFMWQN